MTKIEVLVKAIKGYSNTARRDNLKGTLALWRDAVVDAALDALPELNNEVAERIAQRKDEYLQSWEDEEE